jgi:two-component system, OmpR family, response regulator MprA
LELSGRILVVDDEEELRFSLQHALIMAGYEVAVAGEGEEALSKASTGHYDVILLDVMMPGLDGLTVCRWLRKITSAGIVMVTARASISERVEGLEAGADDYLIKPFAIPELLARVRALLRRTHPDEQEIVAHADVSLNPATREAFRGDIRLQLTGNEFALLSEFLHHPREVLTRERLVQRVWGYEFDGGSNFVDAAVMGLRHKLEFDGKPRLIQTVRGIGYALRES